MRLNFRKQASSRTSFWQGLIKIASLTSGLLLLIGIWSNTEFAQAETARIDNITIERQPDETYESLIGRAEAAARSAVAQGFEQGNSVTDVSVVILGQNQGIIAPLLVVELSRPQWNDRSAPSGVTYFNSARSLLRLDPEQLANTNPNQAPGERNPPAPPQAQQNNSTPRNSREVINRTPSQRTPNQQVPPTLPGATSSPGTQQPTNTPVTSPGNTSTPNNNNTTPIPSPTPVSSPTPIPSPTPVGSPAQTTSPNSVNGTSPQNLPQGTPNNSGTTTNQTQF